MAKVNKLLYVLSLGLLLVGCKKEESNEYKVSFETGYSDITIDDVKTATVNKPTDPTNLTVFGYYYDEAFTNEVTFPATFNESTTIYVKALKGEGTVSNPYIIESSNSFNSMSHLGSTTDKVFEITKDFSMTSTYTVDYENTVFDGTLNGNNHLISLNTYEEDAKSIGYSDTGLLNKLGKNATVKDIRIKGAIEANYHSTGVVANYNEGHVENIKTYGISKHASNGYNSGIRLMTTFNDETGELENDHGTVGNLNDLEKGGVGGIVGTNDGNINDCINYMQVSATIGAGGIAAFNNGTITHCINSGCVGATGNNAINSTQIRDPEFDFSYLGGICAVNKGTVNECGNVNQVFAARLPWKYQNAPSGQNDYSGRIRIGGIVGYNVGTKTSGNYTSGIVSECFNYGRVHGDMQVGGIAGYSSGLVEDCQVLCQIGARFCLGGVVGWQSGDKAGDEPSIVKNCLVQTKIVTGSEGSYYDENGNMVEGIKLEQIGASQSNSTVVEYYKVAKYATSCVYHNYGGMIDPIDPTTGEYDTTSTSSKYVLVENNKTTVNANDNWDYEDKSICTAAVSTDTKAASTTYLNVYLKWTKYTISYTYNGTSGSVSANAGIDYVNRKLVYGSTDKYAGIAKSNLSGFIEGRGLPEIKDSEMWVTSDGVEFDGIATSDVTLHVVER